MANTTGNIRNKEESGWSFQHWGDIDSLLTGYQKTTGSDVTGQDSFLQKFQEYVKQKLDSNWLSKIPSLNSVSLDQLQTGDVVKYRCMVQDVFDPQFCLGRYKIVNNVTGSSRFECGYFKDFPNLGPDETIDFDNPENMTVERQSFYCVPIPGEAQWVKEAYDKKDTEYRRPSCSKEQSRVKRIRDGDEHDDGDLKSSRSEEINQTVEQIEAERERQLVDHSQEETTVNKNNTGDVKVSSKGLTLNFPLSNKTGLPCIARVYSQDVELKATDTAEIIGVLSVDPQLAAIFDDDTEDDNFYSAELQAHEPPPSLVPRLHAMLVRPLHHNNPTLPATTTSSEFQTAKQQLMSDILSLRLELLAILEHALLRDRLAAEYLLSHLLAHVYARADVLPLGKMCLNLSGCLPTQRYTKLLYHLISHLTTQSVLMEMTIENTNSWKLVPKKDYKTNRLTAGMLQLTSGTSLVLDETALHQGQLNETGVLSVKALADVINWQKVDYDFEWHPIPVHTDINVLVLSEGESLLPKDFLVPLVPDSQIMDIPEHFEKLDNRLTHENVGKLRAYITACRKLSYSVPDETQKIMQEDFVESRQANPKNMSVEDFQKLLCLVRLQTLSFGKEVSTIEMWNKVRGMEEERKLRLSQFASNRHGEMYQ